MEGALMIPSLGRIVHYRLTDRDVETINKRRDDFASHRGRDGYTDTGYIAHFGNPPVPGQVFPAAIVRTWGNRSASVANLKVFLDGSDDLWVTSALQGEHDGQWSEPPRV
jgi:hypothetical protein